MMWYGVCVSSHLLARTQGPNDPWLQALAWERARAASAEERAAPLAASELHSQQQLAQAQAERQAERDQSEEILAAVQGEGAASMESSQCRLQTVASLH